MDQPMNPCHFLLSRLEPIEGRAEPVRALDLLHELESLTRKSLEPISPPAPAHAPPPLARSAPSPTPVQYESTHPEYRPALNDRHLVEALLGLFHKSGAPLPELHPISSFAPPPVEKIEVRPKAAPLSKRGSTIASPIFRPRDS